MVFEMLRIIESAARKLKYSNLLFNIGFCRKYDEFANKVNQKNVSLHCKNFIYDVK